MMKALARSDSIGLEPVEPNHPADSVVDRAVISHLPADLMPRVRVQSNAPEQECFIAENTSENSSG